MPGLIERLYRDLVIRGYEDGLHGRRIHTYWSELERTQWLPRPELESLQLRALRQLLAHAAQHCPYYRDDWRQRGLSPEGLQSLEAFSRWPIIDREVIRQNRVTMRSQAPGTVIGLAPRESLPAMDARNSIRIHAGHPGQKTDRRERHRPISW